MTSLTAQVLAPRDVQTTVNYHQPQDDIPYYYSAGREPPEGVPASNARSEPHPATIHDARGKEGTFGLDTSGFQWVNYPSVEREFVDQARVKTVYYTEVEDILKKHAGAKRVFVYNHTVRRNLNPQTAGVWLTPRGPFYCVHADHTFGFAEQKVRECLPDDAERLLKGRYRIINVWRPIANVVAHYPLGAVDFRTVNMDADLVPARLIFPKRDGWTFDVKYNPGHKWYYLSDQTPDEVMLIKCFDSDTDKARLAPHSAFPDTTSPADAPHRQSIEVRALVFDTK